MDSTLSLESVLSRSLEGLPEYLSGLSVFDHRALGEQLEARGQALWKNDKEKLAFITSSRQDRVAKIFECVKRIKESEE